MSEAPSTAPRPGQLPADMFKGISYSEQYDALYSTRPLNTKQVSALPQQTAKCTRLACKSDLGGDQTRAFRETLTLCQVVHSVAVIASAHWLIGSSALIRAVWPPRQLVLACPPFTHP